jgi:hypothetical protein
MVELSDELEACYTLLECSWWSRAWVFQEFIVSSQAYFLFDHQSIPHHFLPAIQHICSFERYKNEWENGAGPVKALEAVEVSSSPSPTPDFVQMNELERKMSLVKVFFDQKAKQDELKPRDLESILERAAHFEASDPRDQIYAFLGLADSGYGIVPDYSLQNNIKDILIETTKESLSLAKA